MSRLLNHILLLTSLLSFLARSQDDSLLIFEPTGGIYSKGPEVKLKGPEGAQIFYSTDGSTPRTDTLEYSAPIKLSKNTVIRAAYIQNGKMSDVVTHSYIFERDYHLPIISIAIDTEKLWNEKYGLLAYGNNYDTVRPYKGANFWQDWEYAANIEHYEKNGSYAFNQVAGLKVFGQFSLEKPQKSMAIIARKKYGTKRFYYPIFDEKPWLDKYKSFVIRNSGGDFSNSHLRDAFMTHLVRNLDIDIQAYKPSVVFINGEYWGIMNMREKLNEHYLKYNRGIDKDKVDIIRVQDKVQHGSEEDYKQFISFLKNTNFSKNENYEILKQKADINNFLIYNITETYTDNRDAGGNVRYYKAKSDSAKWRWLLFDLDLGMGINKTGSYKTPTIEMFTSINDEEWPNPPWSTLMIRKVLENDKGRKMYITYFSDMLNSVFHPDTAIALLDQMTAVINPEMPFHQKRWKNSYDRWKKNIEHMKVFIRKRPHFLRLQLMQKFNLEDTIQVKVNVPDIGSGYVQLNTLKLRRDFEGIYFKKIPLELNVIPGFDYIFDRWEMQDTQQRNFTVKPENDITFEPVLIPRGNSFYHNKVVINEIHFDQEDSLDSEDWIELVNVSSEPVSLTNWFLKDRNDDNNYVFESIEIDSFEYIVIAKNPEKFKKIYSTVDSSIVFGGFDFNLSDEGEIIRLYSPDSLMVDSVRYKVDGDWPVHKSFDKHIALKDPTQANDHSTSWINEKPTPGKENQIYSTIKKQKEERKKRILIYKYLTTSAGTTILIIYLMWIFLKYRKGRKKKKKD